MLLHLRIRIGFQGFLLVHDTADRLKLLDLLLHVLIEVINIDLLIFLLHDRGNVNLGEIHIGSTLVQNVLQFVDAEFLKNDGQHPSLNTFYQMVTMFDISVDQYFYPSKNKGSECRKRIDAMLNALDEKELKIVEATIQAMKQAKETEDAYDMYPEFWTHKKLN